MPSRRKCALLLIASMLVIWLGSSFLFLRQLSDEHGPALPNSFPAAKADVITVAKTVDNNPAAFAANLATLKIAALQKENSDLKRMVNSAPKEAKSGNSEPPKQPPPPPKPALPAHSPDHPSLDSSAFRAAFDRFEAFVLRPSEDKIPGAPSGIIPMIFRTAHAPHAARFCTFTFARTFSTAFTLDLVRNERSA
jgi:hypothetical protein